MTALVALSFQRLGTTRNPRPSLTNAERLMAYRMAVEPELGNYWPWKFTQVYGGARRTTGAHLNGSSELPASTLPARGPASLTLSPEGGDSGATDGDMK